MSDQKFDRLVDLTKIREFERLTGEDRARGGFKTTIGVKSDRPSKQKLWTPGMRVPSKPTFMGFADRGKSYAAKCADAAWHERMLKREGRTDPLDRLRAEQEQAMLQLRAALRMQLGRLTPVQRAKHVSNALFGTPITPEVR